MTQARILIVDDEPITRMDLREILEDAGYIVVGEAGDGETAWQLMQQLKPDLVLMDIKMPGRDGLEISKLAAAEKVAPVVLLTAYSEKNLINAASEAGVLGYLVKPVNERDLLPAVEIALSQHYQMRGLQDQVDSLRNLLEARKLIERAKGILMEKDGCSEHDAFKKLQRLSMNGRCRMEEVARTIIAARELELMGQHPA